MDNLKTTAYKKSVSTSNASASFFRSYFKVNSNKIAGRRNGAVRKFAK